MKVVQLVMSRQFRGAEIFAAQLSRELLSNGVDVLYISLYQNNRPPVLVPEGIRYLDLGATRNSAVSWSLLKQLATVLRDFNPDIVQANAGDTLKYAVLSRLLFRQRYKIVFRNASTVSRYLRSSIQKGLYTLLYRWVDRVISVSEFSRKDFSTTFPALRSRTVVIPNCIIPGSPVRRTDFKDTDFNLVHVGGFTFEKNHEGVLRIFSEVKQKIPNAKLWLVGDGPLKEHIQQLVQQKAIEGVQFTGFVANSIDYIASARVLILPSIIEGMPGVILEAMYSRIPVVAYQVGGIGELVKNSETGWLVKPGDEGGFVNAVFEISEHANIKSVTDQAHQFVMNEFNSKDIGKRFFEAYQDLK